MIMKPTLRQLQYIVAVADEGRFGAAAERLYVSQPSLSAQIAEAEAALGAQVFERGRRGAQPTPMGREIIARARRVLAEMEELRAAARTSDALAGRLRLGVLPSIGPYLLPAAVRRLHRAHPEMKLLIHEEGTETLAAGLIENRLDMVISTPEDHDGEHLPLFDESFWICVATDDALAAADTPITLDALAGRTLLTLGAGHRLSAIVRNLADAAGALVEADYQGGSPDALRLMAASGAGVAILPSLYAMTEARRGGDLALRRIDHPLAHRRIALVWRRGSPVAEGARLLAKELTQAADEALR